MPNELAQLQKILKYKFKDIKILQNALTHKSFACEKGNEEHNERMEFLGDSILSAVSADFLYHRYYKQDEGKLSQLKSQLVSSAALSKWARDLKLGTFIFVSGSDEQSGARQRDTLLCDSIEAIIAGIYLDGGYKSAEKFIINHLSQFKRVVVNDPKSKLQELVQAVYQTLPEYRVLGEVGPDHDKSFKIGVYIKRKKFGMGQGKSKKEAQQEAAREALKSINKKKSK